MNDTKATDGLNNASGSGAGKSECLQIADSIMDKLTAVCDKRKIPVESLLVIGIEIFANAIKDTGE